MQATGYTRVRRYDRYESPEAARLRAMAARQAEELGAVREKRTHRRDTQFSLEGQAQIPYVNSGMNPVYRETVQGGERVQLLRRRLEAEKHSIQPVVSRKGLRYDLMFLAMTALCVLLLTVWLVGRSGYWASMDRVSRADLSIRETEKRIAELQSEIDEKSAALNVAYKAVELEMVASSSQKVVSLYAPQDAITLPNGETDPTVGARSASNQ